MPQVFNANSLWKTCFINNFHEIPSNHSFHMCHNELILIHTNTKDREGDEINEHKTHATSNGNNSMLCGHHQPEILLTHCDLAWCAAKVWAICWFNHSEILLVIFSVYTLSNLKIINHN